MAIFHGYVTNYQRVMKYVSVSADPTEWSNSGNIPRTTWEVSEVFMGKSSIHGYFIANALCDFDVSTLVSSVRISREGGTPILGNPNWPVSTHRLSHKFSNERCMHLSSPPRLIRPRARIPTFLDVDRRRPNAYCIWLPEEIQQRQVLGAPCSTSHSFLHVFDIWWYNMIYMQCFGPLNSYDLRCCSIFLISLRLSSC